MQASGHENVKLAWGERVMLLVIAAALMLGGVWLAVSAAATALGFVGVILFVSGLVLVAATAGFIRSMPVDTHILSRRGADHAHRRWTLHRNEADDLVGSLERLERLRERGTLGPNEFEAAKERLLNPPTG